MAANKVIFNISTDLLSPVLLEFLHVYIPCDLKYLPPIVHEEEICLTLYSGRSVLQNNCNKVIFDISTDLLSPVLLKFLHVYVYLVTSNICLPWVLVIGFPMFTVNHKVITVTCWGQ